MRNSCCDDFYWLDLCLGDQRCVLRASCLSLCANFTPSHVVAKPASFLLPHHVHVQGGVFAGALDAVSLWCVCVLFFLFVILHETLNDVQGGERKACDFTCSCALHIAFVANDYLDLSSANICLLDDRF